MEEKKIRISPMEELAIHEIRLSVNVDHVATVREARRSKEPDPVHAAMLARIAGADGITVHLRSDRRHIKERDVKLIKETIDIPLTVEMGFFDDILEFVMDVKPDKVTLVPEREGEVTTEGGLNIPDNIEKVRDYVSRLKSAGIKVGVFIEPDNEMIDYACSDCGVDFVELNTTQYSLNPSDEKILRKIRTSADYASRKGLEVLAGHALSLYNVAKIAEILDIDELSIGHSIVSRAIFVGFEKAVAEMKSVIRQARILSLARRK